MGVSGRRRRLALARAAAAYRVLAAPCASFAAVVLPAFQRCAAWMIRLVADRLRGALVLGATFHILADPLGRDEFYSSIRAALDDDAVFLTSFSAFVLGTLAFLENYFGLSSSVYFPASETSTRGVTGTCVASLSRLPDVANAESVEITSSTVRRRLRVVCRSMKRRSSSTGAAGARRTTRSSAASSATTRRARAGTFAKRANTTHRRRRAHQSDIPSPSSLRARPTPFPPSMFRINY